LTGTGLLPDANGGMTSRLRDQPQLIYAKTMTGALSSMLIRKVRHSQTIVPDSPRIVKPSPAKTQDSKHFPDIFHASLPSPRRH
jgi:hypothetical protein